MPWPQTGATHYHAQLGFPDKSRGIKGLVVCNSRYIIAFGPEKQPEPELISNISCRKNRMNMRTFINAKFKNQTCKQNNKKSDCPYYLKR